MSDPENDKKETPFYFREEYHISLRNAAYVTFDNNVETCFSVKPETFKEAVCCVTGKRSLEMEAEMLINEYNVNVNDCGTPGIEIKLAFEHIRRHCKKPNIDVLKFFMYKSFPEYVSLTKSQQDNVDHGVPYNVAVNYLYILISAGFNPRVHERLDYDHLYLLQYYSKENNRIYHTINDKMLRSKLLALCCFISNPEALSRFEGWGLLVNYAYDNKVDKSLIEDVIDGWIENQPIRRLTGLFERSEPHKSESCPGKIMTKEEEDAILEKLACASSKVEKENMGTVISGEQGEISKMRMRFTRKQDCAEGDLYITWENSKCVGMAFLQPPDEDTAFFLNRIAD